MNKRPLSITIIGWLFIVVGCAGIIRGLLPLIQAVVSRRTADFTTHDWGDVAIVCAISLLALVGGPYVLLGSNLGRWLLVVWMGIHIIISMMHTLSQLLMHIAIFAVILYYLFRPSASEYFRGARFEEPPSPV